MKNAWMTLLTLAVAVFAAPGRDAIGQSRALQQRLATATQLDCRFSTLVTGDWQAGEPNATVDTTEFELSFFDVNVDEGTAEADSRFGASFIVIRHSNEYLHLMQMFGTGPLYVTSVMAREVSDGRFMAVHTRHEFTPIKLAGFTSRPEMYLGDCALTN